MPRMVLYPTSERTGAQWQRWRMLWAEIKLDWRESFTKWKRTSGALKTENLVVSYLAMKDKPSIWKLIPIFSQVQSRRNLKPSELESVKSIQFINSVKVFVDPLSYKQVISYHTTPMLPLGCIRGRRRNWWRQWRGQSPMYDANYSLKLWRRGRTGIETNAVKTARKKDRWMFGNRMPWEFPWYFYWERYLSTCRQGKQASKWRCNSERLWRWHILCQEYFYISATRGQKGGRISRWSWLFMRQRVPWICFA